MKRVTNKIMFVALAATVTSAMLPLSAQAESVERIWKSPDAAEQTRPSGLLNSFGPQKSQKLPSPRPIVPAEGTVNFNNKKTHEVSPVKNKNPVVVVKKKTPVVRKVKTRKKLKKKFSPVVTATKQPTRSKQGKWWDTVGNPAVFAFRDCSVRYAKQQTASGQSGQTGQSASETITAAMKSSCQVEFAKMAGVLVGGLGEKRSNIMLAELAKTTFLPAVVTAMKPQEKLPLPQVVKVVVQVSDEEKMKIAKASMFSCFSERTDRLTIAKNIQANTIADAVLIGCQAKSDVFFDLLFAHSKARPQVKQKQKNIALNETYRIAIIRRVLATRKPGQVKTATQQ